MLAFFHFLSVFVPFKWNKQIQRCVMRELLNVLLCVIFLGARTRCGQDWYGEQRRKQPVYSQYVDQRQLPEQFCQQSDGCRRRQERGGHGGRPHRHVCHTPQTSKRPRPKHFKHARCTFIHLLGKFQEEQTNNEETEPNNRPTEPQSQPAQTPRPKRNREHFATIRTASVVMTRFIND